MSFAAAQDDLERFGSVGLGPQSPPRSLRASIYSTATYWSQNSPTHRANSNNIERPNPVETPEMLIQRGKLPMSCLSALKIEDDECIVRVGMLRSAFDAERSADISGWMEHKFKQQSFGEQGFSALFGPILFYYTSKTALTPEYYFDMRTHDLAEGQGHIYLASKDQFKTSKWSLHTQSVLVRLTPPGPDSFNCWLDYLKKSIIGTKTGPIGSPVALNLITRDKVDPLRFFSSV